MKHNIGLPRTKLADNIEIGRKDVISACEGWKELPSGRVEFCFDISIVECSGVSARELGNFNF